MNQSDRMDDIFPPVPPEEILLQYTIRARTYRLPMLCLLLLCAVVFGVVGYFFFDHSALDSVLMALGLDLLILTAWPPSHFAYRFTVKGLDKAELSADRYDLKVILPMLVCVFILIVLFLSLPARAIAYAGLAAALALTIARAVLPRKRKYPVRSVVWEQVAAIVIGESGRAFALREKAPDGAVKTTIVHCRRKELQRLVDLVEARLRQELPVDTEALIR